MHGLTLPYPDPAGLPGEMLPQAFVRPFLQGPNESPDPRQQPQLRAQICIYKSLAHWQGNAKPVATMPLELNFQGQGGTPTYAEFVKTYTVADGSEKGTGYVDCLRLAVCKYLQTLPQFQGAVAV